MCLLEKMFHRVILLWKFVYQIDGAAFVLGLTLDDDPYIEATYMYIPCKWTLS